MKTLANVLGLDTSVLRGCVFNKIASLEHGYRKLHPSFPRLLITALSLVFISSPPSNRAL